MSKITYANKNTGDEITSDEFNQIKTVVNANDDELISAFTEIENKVDKDGAKVLSDVNFSSSKDLKLSNIENNATLNESDSYLIDRANHTGQQDISSVVGLQEELDSKLNSADDISADSITENNTRYFVTQEMFNFLSQLMTASNNNE